METKQLIKSLLNEVAEKRSFNYIFLDIIKKYLSSNKGVDDWVFFSDIYKDVKIKLKPYYTLALIVGDSKVYKLIDALIIVLKNNLYDIYHTDTIFKEYTDCILSAPDNTKYRELYDKHMATCEKKLKSRITELVQHLKGGEDYKLVKALMAIYSKYNYLI